MTSDDGGRAEDLRLLSDGLKRRRVRRFLLWLLPARRVKIAPEPSRLGPQNLGGWSDLPYE